MSTELTLETTLAWWERARRSSTLVTGALLATVLLGLMIAAGLGLTGNPYAQEAPPLLAPVPGQWLGTDNLGRDVAARLAAGTLVSLAWSMAAAFAATLVGLAIGAVGALGPRWLAASITHLAEATLALPILILCLALAVTLGQTHASIAIAVAVAMTPQVARIVRTECLALRKEDFVVASRLLGTPLWRHVWLHLLPALTRLLAIQLCVRSSSAIWAEAGLGFLGAGPPPPTPSWGLMIAEGKDFLLLQPWACLGPSIMASIAVLAGVLLADGLSEIDRTRPQW